jgi:cobalt/nickel transport system ATP-binding protein
MPSPNPLPLGEGTGEGGSEGHVRRSLPPIILIEHLSYTYPDGTKALDDVSLVVERGECLGIIGPNGAGKSTLLLHLNGTLRGSGRVLIDGLEVTKANLPEVRRSIGLIFQDSNDQLFMPTVFDDVAFGPLNLGLSAEEVRQRVAEALAIVGKEGFEERAPYHLSDGEKRAIAIATVLAMKPQVLAMDEPTSSLDHRSRRALIELLRSLSAEGVGAQGSHGLEPTGGPSNGARAGQEERSSPITKLLVTHDLELVLELSTRSVLMDAGRIVADRPSRDLLGDAGLLARFGMEVPHSLIPHPHGRVGPA